MGVLDRLLGPRAQSSPIDDFWYQPVGLMTNAGVRMSADTAMTLSTVYACIRILANTLGMLPLPIFEHMTDGGKRRAPKHPLYYVLHDRPNNRQTSIQWRQMMVGHMALRGNAYSQIILGNTGYATELIPLNPDRVRVELLETGRLRYRYQPQNGREEVFLQDEILHFSTMSLNGVTGLSLIGLARQSFGLTMALESHGARFFSQGARPGGTLQHPGKLGKEAHERLRDSWKEHYGGLEGAHRPAILEEGMEWKQLSVNNDDAQFLDSRRFQAAEVAQWFGVPLELLQLEGRGTTWGTGIENLLIAFVTFTMDPWFVTMEQTINSKLVLQPDRFFVEFVREALMRGDGRSRSTFYSRMVPLGVMTRNEVRTRENLNPLPGLDAPLTPLNMSQGGVTQKAMVLALDASGRLVRREISAIRKAAPKYADDPEGWRSWVEAFYHDLRGDVAEITHLDSFAVGAYCEDQVRDLMANGVDVLERWDRERPAALAALMMGGDEDAIADTEPE